MVWIPPTRNSQDCECVEFLLGAVGQGKLRGIGSLCSPGPWSSRWGLLGKKGQSPGSRFLSLGPGTYTVRTKGASFCFKAPAARPPHRNISASATPDLLLPFFSRTNRQVKHRRARPALLFAPPPLPSHALHAGSSSQLRVGIGQLSWPASKEEKETLPGAYCAGVMSVPHCDWPPQREDLRMCTAFHKLAKSSDLLVSFARVGGS